MKILFHLPSKVTQGIYEKDPSVSSELFYGADYLAKIHELDLNEDRFDRLDGKSPKFLKRNGLGFIGISTLSKVLRSDLVIVKDDFSFLISLLCLISNKKLIYIDSMFFEPTRLSVKAIFKFCIKSAYTTVSFSRSQIAVWERILGISKKFTFLPYCIDFSFYDQYKIENRKSANQLLGIGRDIGRDFNTLLRSIDGLDIYLNLVTLPYLLNSKNLSSNVVTYENLSYLDLLELYSSASYHVIPLKEAYSYPSGIRAVFESIAMRTKVVATNTPVLKEYFSEDIEFFDAGDVESLKRKMSQVTKDQANELSLSEQTYQKIRQKYDYFSVYCVKLLSVIESLENSSTPVQDRLNRQNEAKK